MVIILIIELRMINPMAIPTRFLLHIAIAIHSIWFMVSGLVIELGFIGQEREQ